MKRQSNGAGRDSKIKRTADVETKPNTRGLIPCTARTLASSSIDNNEPPSSPPVPGEIDPGIRQAVQRLQEAGIETCESCEGGPGHAYPEPTVAFYGTAEAGWRAIAVCIAFGLPVQSLRRVWDVLEANEPTGPHWEVTFRRRTL
jgi:hypothetical protein